MLAGVDDRRVDRAVGAESSHDGGDLDGLGRVPKTTMTCGFTGDLPVRSVGATRRAGAPGGWCAGPGRSDAVRRGRTHCAGVAIRRARSAADSGMLTRRSMFSRSVTSRCL